MAWVWILAFAAPAVVAGFTARCAARLCGRIKINGAIYPIIVVVLVGALVALEFGLWAIGHLYGYDGTCTPLLTPTLEPSRWTCDWEEFAEIQLKGAMMASAPALWINAIIVPIVFVATVGRRRVGP